MQYHQNGFFSGDPSIAKPINKDRLTSKEKTQDRNFDADVLIVGCGPAGLTLAAQLSVFPNIKTRIIEQKPGPLEYGQADGIACRTIEMFEAFGFSEKVVKEAYWVNETTFWKPDKRQNSNIIRSGRIQDTEDGLSEFPHVILSQARVHDFFLEFMRNSVSQLEPDYAYKLIDFKIADEPSQGITVEIEKTSCNGDALIEKIKTRYLVGCDGARSSVRKNLGAKLHGETANQAWGVMDVLAITDFPDIRLKTVIHSANEGSMLIIPREGGYLVRFYIELDKLNKNERVSARNISIEKLIAAAKRILHPYSLEVAEVAWWSVYEIGQRLCDNFDNTALDKTSTRPPCVFIAGDACHTHSPKAGQGMNVSMADGFNLGWKLANVILGKCEPELLHSYSFERRAIANELIDFDREFAKMFSARPKTSGNEAPKAAKSDEVDPAEFQRYFVKQGRFTAGTAVQYLPSIICADTNYQHLATGLKIGMRFHSAPVIRLADARPLQLGHIIKADGRWRIFLFSSKQHPKPGDSQIHNLCNWLVDSPASPINIFTQPGDDIDSAIDFRAIFQQSHRDLQIETMPPLLRPQKGKYRLADYEKSFCPDIKSRNDIFDMRGINRNKGCIVIVRPDQFLAQILPLDEPERISEFLGSFMIARP